MSKFIINGPAKLSGEIEVYGAKNAALKMIAASVLIKDEVVLENVPEIVDIEVLCDILRQNGAEILRNGHSLKINTTNLQDLDPDRTKVRKFRGSVVLIGPYLARFGHIKIAQPGGCAIGARPLDDHINGFKQLNTTISEQDDYFVFERLQMVGQNIEIRPSVTATENMIMTQVLAKGQTIIKNVAKEPQIKDLAEFLNAAGAKISHAGTNEIKIEGVEKLHGLTYKVMPDPFEACTYVCLGIVTKSLIKITNCNPKHLYPFLDKVKEIGVEFIEGENYIELSKIPEKLNPTEIVADVYPHFSTDMQAQMGLVLTQATGESRVEEKLFENRLGYLKELEKMGAKVEIINAHEAKIFGPTALYGAKIISLDLRAGATVILAGLAASGETVIDNVEIIDRGYECIEKRLQKLGADITRVNSEEI